LENNQRLIGLLLLQYEAKVYPLDLMQDVISQLAENPAYKILLLEEEERNRNFRCAVKLKRQCYQRGWENEVTTRVGAH
jgi:hypothetical protein